MPKNQIIKVEWHEIVIFSKEWEDFICLTDIMKSVDGNQKIEKWISNRSTIDFLWTWEAMHNPDYNYSAFGDIRAESWNNTFTISVKKRKEKTNAIWIFSKIGKFWWTYAHKDIAFEFASRLSPQFKLYIIKEFQRLKEDEQRNLELWRDVKRLISKVNYRLHTDAIKDILAPKTSKQNFLYATEADLLNLSVFRISSAERAKNNPKKAKNWNIRDDASVEELTVLSNLEVLNSEMIKNEVSQEKRLEILQQRAKEQLKTLSTLASMKKLKEKQQLEETKKLWHKK